MTQALCEAQEEEGNTGGALAGRRDNGGGEDDELAVGRVGLLVGMKQAEAVALAGLTGSRREVERGDGG